MKNYFAVFLDLIFFTIISFFISVIWLRYFFDSTFLIIFLSVIISIFIGIFLLLFKYKNQKKDILNKQDEQKFKNYKQFFLTNTTSNINQKLSEIFTLRKNSDYLYKTFNSYYFTKTNNYFIGGNNTVFLYFLDSLVVEDFQIKHLLSKNNFLNKENFKFFILGNDFSENSKQFILLFKNITLLTLEDFYKKTVKGLNLFYSPIDSHKTKKIKNIKFLYKLFINTKNTKNFFLCAITIFITSFVFRYNIYYIVLSSILFVLSLMCKIVPSFKKNI